LCRPTAVHAFAAVQDTLLKRLYAEPFAPPGFAVDWIFQLVPFQRSASVLWPLKYLVPTAVHSFAAVQDTALREVLFPTPGFAVVWTFQLVPFQRSARIW
jgi:hypothetical protein